MDNENVNEEKNDEFDPGEVYHSMNEKQQRVFSRCWLPMPWSRAMMKRSISSTIQKEAR